MEITGVAFICVIFVISIALVGFCCLKFCSSEEKYVRNPEKNNTSRKVSTSTISCSVNENQLVYPSTITSDTSKSLPLGVASNRIKGKTNSKFRINVSSPPKSGFFVDKTRKKRFIVNETECATLRPDFEIGGSGSEARSITPQPPGTRYAQSKQTFVTDRTQYAAPKPGFVINQLKFAALKSSFITNKARSATPKPAYVLDRARSMTPQPDRTQLTPTKQAYVGNRPHTVTSKPEFLIDRTRSVTPKPAYAIDKGRSITPQPNGTRCTPPKQAYVGDRSQTEAPIPRFYVKRIQYEAPKPGFVMDASQFVPPKAGFIIDKSESEVTPKLAIIGFGHTGEGMSTDNVPPSLPYVKLRERRGRTPSPNPETHRTSYSPRTSLYFTENAGPLSGIHFSSENLNNLSKSRPPSYEEAMVDYQFPDIKNSDEGQFSKSKLNS